jgi:O-antigen ligase
MAFNSDENVLAKALIIGAPLITLAVVSAPVTDPVNTPKFVILGGLAFALLATFSRTVIRKLWLESKFLLVALGLFITGLFIAIFPSQSPVTQNLYGVYGRNTGFLAYLFLTIVCLAASVLRQMKYLRALSYAFLLSGVLNVLYSAWVLLFGDPIGWSNPYGAILGTFGNPNFISSFLGMTAGALFAMFLSEKLAWSYRIGCVILASISMFELTKTGSIQGYVVAAVSVAFVIYLKIRGNKNRYFSWVYLSGAVVASILAVLGTFQVGPLTKYIYQGTLAFRGQYWKAGINMGLSEPFTGVGPDSYGNYYRMFRDPQALITPGVQTITNSAHNVIIDQLASGGFLVLLSYLAVLALGLISLVKIVLRNKEFDPVFAVLGSVWFGYQLQSIISINQLGLAIWGWLTTGCLIAYEKLSKESINAAETSTGRQASSTKNLQNSSVITPQLRAGLGLLAGILVALPPLNADMKWRTATESKNANLVIAALKPAYLNPPDSQRFAQAVELFASSNLLEQAHSIALDGIKFSPDYFDAWRMLYFLSNSTTEEKALALANMKRLDPLNPDVTAR